MENISPIYENVDIRDWAQDIRLSKIQELEISIKDLNRTVDVMKKQYAPYRSIEKKNSIF